MREFPLFIINGILGNFETLDEGLVPSAIFFFGGFDLILTGSTAFLTHFRH